MKHNHQSQTLEPTRFSNPPAVLMTLDEWRKLDERKNPPKPWHREAGQRWKLKMDSGEWLLGVVMSDPLDSSYVYTIQMRVRIGKVLVIGIPPHPIQVAGERVDYEAWAG